MTTEDKCNDWFEHSSIPGVFIRFFEAYKDSRGYLLEICRSDTLLPADHRPVMEYVSATKPGVCRGPHEHTDQTDYFIFMPGTSFTVYLWDNRLIKSPRRHEIVTDADGYTGVIVPPGVVHAYKNTDTSSDGIVLNLPDRLYAGKDKRDKVDEIRHEDNPSSVFVV